nr:hypothetical protein [Plantibacter sp. VKM Ac-2885]
MATPTFTMAATDPSPSARPARLPIAPTTAPSRLTDRRCICAVEPMRRRRAIVLVLPATIVAKVLTVTIEPTYTASATKMVAVRARRIVTVELPPVLPSALTIADSTSTAISRATPKNELTVATKRLARCSRERPVCFDPFMMRAPFRA